MTSTAVPTARARTATRRKARRPSRILLHLFLAFVASAFLGSLQRLLPARVRNHRIVEVALDVASVARHLARSWKLGGTIVAASMLMQVCNVLAMFVLARAV